jgi:hypothetical protein
MRLRRTIYLNKDKRWRVKISHHGRVYPEYRFILRDSVIWQTSQVNSGISHKAVGQVRRMKVYSTYWLTTSFCITRMKYDYQAGCQRISIATVKNIYKNALEVYRRHERK